MENKFSFRKRIQLCKKETFESLQDIELDKTANKRAGYYSLKSIMSVLNGMLDKYDIDIEIAIAENMVTFTWYDCNSEDVRATIIDISKIKDVGRLPSMSNEVQSYGAILTYVRRYALTVVLNLNATDILENNTQQPTQTSHPQKTQQSKSNFTPTMKTKYDIINEAQRKLLFAKMKEYEISETDLHIVITKLFQKVSINDLTTDDLNILLKRLENNKNKKKVS